jgi:Tfp pilus assembly protein PilN
MADESDKGFLINEKTMEVLVAKFIPTSQYFERSFDLLQSQIGDLRDGQKDLKQEMDRRFEQVDKRFEQVDKRFEQVDKRFEQIDVKLDTIIERLDIKVDAGLRENRAMSFRLFSFAMVFSAISMAGLLGKLTGLF